MEKDDIKLYRETFIYRYFYIIFKRLKLMEIEKLNKMIENNDYNINDFTLEQSIKVDKLVIFYTALKLVIINEKLGIIQKNSNLAYHFS